MHNARQISLSAILAIALGAAPTVAVAQVGPTIGASLGAVFPAGDLGDQTNTGYQVGFTLGFHPPLSPIGLRGEATYGELGNEFGGNSTRLVTLTANAIFGVSSPTSVVGINPYVIVGGGWYSYDPRRAVTLLESQKQNKLGLNGGVGLRVGLAGFSTYAEARYHYIFVDDVGNSRPNISFIPLTFGITF